MRELFRKLFGTDFKVKTNPTHLDEVERILKAGAAGKRLDFLMQELNREANTLGSKAMAHEQSAIRLHNLADKLDALLDPADPV